MVTFSYDAGQIQSAGYSAISLNSFDFVLSGAPFDRSEISEGGQVLLTASYQSVLPMSPVRNIKFGFGPPGTLEYIDLNDQPGTGVFTLASLPEPPTSVAAAVTLFITLLYLAFRARRPGWNPKPRPR